MQWQNIAIVIQEGWTTHTIIIIYSFCNLLLDYCLLKKAIKRSPIISYSLELGSFFSHSPECNFGLWYIHTQNNWGGVARAVHFYCKGVKYQLSCLLVLLLRNQPMPIWFWSRNNIHIKWFIAYHRISCELWISFQAFNSRSRRKIFNFTLFWNSTNFGKVGQFNPDFAYEKRFANENFHFYTLRN